MIDPRAEESFREGDKLLEQGLPRQALALLSAAVQIDEKERVADEAPQARYLSSYGLCLCLLRREHREALRLCRKAVGLEPYRPSLWNNLGQVALALNRRREAYQAWQRGLTLEPGHPTMRSQVHKMGLRRPPVLSVVSRHHPLNIVLGKFRDFAGKPLTGQQWTRLAS